MPDEKRSNKKETKKDKEKKISKKISKGEKSDTILASLYNEIKKNDKPVEIDKLLDRKDKSKKKHSKEKKEKSRKKKREKSDSSRSRSPTRKDKKKKRKEKKEKNSDVELSPWRKNLIEETLGVKINDEKYLERVSDEDDLPIGSDFSTIRPSTSKQKIEEKDVKDEYDDDLIHEESFPIAKEKPKNRSPSPDDVLAKLKSGGPKTDILKKVSDLDKDKAMMPRNIKIQLKTSLISKKDGENEKKNGVKKEIKAEAEKDVEEGELSDSKRWATLNSDEEQDIKEKLEELKMNGKMMISGEKKKEDDDMSISTYQSEEEKAREEWTKAKQLKEEKKSGKKSSKISKKGKKVEKSKPKSSSKTSKSRRARSRASSHGTYSKSRSRSRTYSSKSRSRSRSSRTKSRSRSRSYSKSRSRSYSRSDSRSRRRSHSRSRSRSKSRSRSYDKKRRYTYRVRGSYRGRYNDYRRRPYAKKPIPPPRRNRVENHRYLSKLDKEKLLEIATKNATRMAMEGRLPGGMELLETIKNKSVKQLVKICEQLQEDKYDETEKREAISSDEEERYEKLKSHKSRKRSHSGSGEDFRSKPVKASKIEINITNANPLPVRTHQQLMDEGILRLSFPVSSGAEHRVKDLESAYKDWQPVQKNYDASDLQLVKVLEKVPVKIPLAYKELTLKESQKAAIGPALLPPGVQSGGEPTLPPPPEPPSLEKMLLPPPPIAPNIGNINSNLITPDSLLDTIRLSSGLSDGLGDKDVPLTFRLPAPPAPPSLRQEDMVFGVPRNLKRNTRNLNELVAERAKYNARLMKNPNDAKAKLKIAEIDDEMSSWAESKNLPGHFAGSTGVRVLKPDELEPMHPKYHAWAKKDMFKEAAPVSSGIGLKMLQKMGWEPGKGLGRNLSGPVNPLVIDVKADKKGLASDDDKKVGKKEMIMNINGKHPVSVVTEICNRRHWPQPSFTCIEMGPQNNRRFLWKALLNGVEYEPSVPSTNKKAGKSQVCLVILQSLGVIGNSA